MGRWAHLCADRPRSCCYRRATSTPGLLVVLASTTAAIILAVLYFNTLLYPKGFETLLESTARSKLVTTSTGAVAYESVAYSHGNSTILEIGNVSVVIPDLRRHGESTQLIYVSGVSGGKGRQFAYTSDGAVKIADRTIDGGSEVLFGDYSFRVVDGILHAPGGLTLPIDKGRTVLILRHGGVEVISRNVKSVEK